MNDDVVIFKRKTTEPLNDSDDSTDSIDLNEDKVKKQEDDELKDMGLFDGVCINTKTNKRSRNE